MYMYNSKYVYVNTYTNKNACPYPRWKETSSSHGYSERQWLGLDEENAVMVCLFSQYGTLREKKISREPTEKHPKEKQILKNMKRSQNRGCIYFIL